MSIHWKVIALCIALGLSVAKSFPGGGNRSLEEDVRWYIQATDTSSNRELREKILSKDKELKAILEKIVREPISNVENHFFELELLAAISWGMEDKVYGRDFTRRVLRLFKDWPFEFSPIFFGDYLKYDPEGAEATFRKLAEIGNENVRGYAEGYLAKIAEGRVPADHRPLGRPNSEEPARGNPALEPGGDTSAGGLSWLLVALCGVLMLGIVFVLFRSRSHR